MSSILKAFVIDDPTGYTIEPASAKREWMDATPGKFAYHCMPLTIANQCGWVIPCPTSFSATWNGKVEKEAIAFRFPEREDFWKLRITSHFGSGIITFGVPWVFRTAPGWGLLVRGPTNLPKENLTPLDGLVETDWAPYTFTMNWKILKRNSEVWFKKGEPICMLMPFLLAAPEDAQPSFHVLEEDPALRDDYLRFRAQRSQQNAQRAATGAGMTTKGYFRGRRPDGSEVDEHRTNFRLKSFKPLGG